MQKSSPEVDCVRLERGLDDCAGGFPLVAARPKIDNSSVRQKARNVGVEEQIGLGEDGDQSVITIIVSLADACRKNLASAQRRPGPSAKCPYSSHDQL